MDWWSLLGLAILGLVVSRIGRFLDWSHLGLVVLGLVLSRIGRSRNGTSTVMQVGMLAITRPYVMHV
jgi:hypothetical protein